MNSRTDQHESAPASANVSGRPAVVVRLGSLALLEQAPLDPPRRRRLERACSGLGVSRLGNSEELVPFLSDAEAYVTDSAPVDAALLELARRLRFIQICGSLTDWVDLRACADRQVVVSRLDLPSTRAVAEHTMLLALAAAHRLGPANAALHGWMEKPPVLQPAVTYPGGCYNWLGLDPGILRGRRLGVLGLGDVGAEVARLARRLGMRVAYYRRNRLTAAEERRLGVRYVPFDELVRTSDVFTVHVRRTPETTGMVSREVIRRLPSGAILVNTSRGGIVDHEALAEALRDGHVAGAGVDVFPEEPAPRNHALAGCAGALLTAHCAGGSLDLLLDEITLILGNTRRALTGCRIRGLIRGALG